MVLFTNFGHIDSGHLHSFMLITLIKMSQPNILFLFKPHFKFYFFSALKPNLRLFKITQIFFNSTIPGPILIFFTLLSGVNLQLKSNSSHLEVNVFFQGEFNVVVPLKCRSFLSFLRSFFDKAFKMIKTSKWICFT